MGERQRFFEERLALANALALNPDTVSSDSLQPLVESSLAVEEKYQEINAVSIILTNIIGEPHLYLQRISTAFNILEKYGRNLLNPQKPKYWRSVKFNNPVFKSTVDNIKGGRTILRLYGYTEAQPDGMSFQEDVQEPDYERVAYVTLEVTLLRLELNLLLADKHPHPEIFQDLLQVSHVPEPTLLVDSCQIPAQTAQTGQLMPSYPADPQPTGSMGSCGLCGEQDTSVHCPTCQQALCSECDGRFHKHPSRAHHQRAKVQAPGSQSMRQSTVLGSPPAGSPLPLRNLPAAGPSVFGSTRVPYPTHGSSYFPAGIPVTSKSMGTRSPAPGRGNPAWAPVPDPLLSMTATTRPPWRCAACTTMNEARSVLCVGCDRPRGCKTTPFPEPDGKSLARCSWSCQACTFENESAAVLCVVCERPRLAGKPSLMVTEAQPLESISKETKVKEVCGWHCEHCTFWNTMPGGTCVMCNGPSAHAGIAPAPKPPSTAMTLGSGDQPARPMLRPVQPTPVIGEQEFQRQQRLQDEGAKLIHMIRVAEASGISPEEAYCAVQYSGTEVPVQWLQTELPYVLETVVELAAQKTNGVVGAMTHHEAKKAWLSCAGNIEDAALECINIRKKKIKEIENLGFRNLDHILQALYTNAGDVGRAVIELQRQLLEPFHTRLWQNHEPDLCFDSPDKSSMVRRILAIFSLPSWGRAELVLTLMQEQDRRCELQDIVEAVRQSHDKDFIKRMLTQPCATCFAELPRNKMQSLTSCECTICPDCFKMHFTIAVKEKHIKDMVCPGCNAPEINDEGELLNYFSTLDILLRDCLDPDVLNIFHKKLTERTLMKDPKFLWCTHCSFGFIYERQQLEAQCPQCRQSFCIKCKRPWEEQHKGITCDEFLNWKRENDPQYQAQGLAMYLQENGIDCPHCKFSYALARGGCMHFVCSQCRHQFCSGCYNTFFNTNNRCTEPSCLVKMTLHAHHPRDCLFYLRDWDVDRLQKLLQDNNLAFNTDPPAGTQAAPGGGCRVLEQKEGVDRLKDEPCGKPTPAGHAGLCQSHYKEYLVRLINNHKLDPAALYDINEFTIVCNRYLPQGTTQRLPEEDDQGYCARLLRKLTKDIPLGERIPRKKQ